MILTRVAVIERYSWVFILDHGFYPSEIQLHILEEPNYEDCAVEGK